MSGLNPFQERVGVGSTNYALGRTAPTRDRKIIAEEGPRRGRLAAIETDHKDGRQDARVFVDTIRKTIRTGGDE